MEAHDPMKSWHTATAPETLDALGVDSIAGLSRDEARKRAEQIGSNEIAETGAKSLWRILWEQFTATMVLILLAAAGLAAVVGSLKDTAVILAIVVLFAVLGFIQEYRAERAMAALKRLASPIVRVRRAGLVDEVPARDLVPGDLVLLEAGNLVPADCRLVKGANLRTQESSLTGESEAVEKEPDAVADEDAPLGDRRSMLYMGTAVTYGRGTAVVVETGMRTELGRIAAMMQQVRGELTPLQRRLDQLGKTIGVIAVLVAAVVAVVGLAKGEELSLMLMTAVSVAVAAVPEGLPAVVTITLALGAQRMLSRQALIRKLPAVETLGSVTVICSDKTGTLTQNHMTVTAIEAAGRGELRAVDEELLLSGAALCNDVAMRHADDGGAAGWLGDPTEVALAEAAARAGLAKIDLEAAMPRTGELPFDSDRKRMTTIHRLALPAGSLPPGVAALAASCTGGAPRVAFVKGAVDGLLALSTHLWAGDAATPLDEAERRRIAERNDALAADGLRVLGIAARVLDEPALPAAPEALERDLVFLGLVGMIDLRARRCATRSRRAPRRAFAP
jgi:Ca2+-transporting ATPase